MAPRLHFLLVVFIFFQRQALTLGQRRWITLPPPMNTKTPERDWLLTSNRNTTATCSPPEPISGPIEGHHDPDLLLSHFRDEKSWSEEIKAWGKNHSLFTEADEELE